MNPVRLQRRRTRGANIQAESIRRNGLPALVVTRPGIFGNPFIHPEPQKAVDAYRRLCTPGGGASFEMGPGGLQFAKDAHPDTLHWAFREWMQEHGLRRLRGHNLACYCLEGSPCHADVLLELICEAV